MNIPYELRTHIASLLIEINQGGREENISIRAIYGGSINDAAAASLNGHTLFVKWNSAKRYPNMFEAESKGLKLMKNPGGAFVPDVIDYGTFADVSYLILSFIEQGYGGKKQDEMFGVMVAEMHKNSHDKFGLDHDNYMGSLLQSNTFCASWNEFFITQRLMPQMKIARNYNYLSKIDVEAFENLFEKLPDIIPDEKPALVHGDLWSGNYLNGTEMRTWLFDPAVAYGHREVDIAMSKMFGGFPGTFYEAYNYYFPLELGWESRIALFQLYPVLIHLNLFGTGYLRSAKDTLKNFYRR